MSSQEKVAALIDDWREECAVLDRALQTLEADAWHTETLAEGWDIRDTIGHLSDTNDIMLNSVTGGPRDLITEYVAAAGGEGADLADENNVDAFTAWQMTKVRQMTGPDAYAWWKQTSSDLADLIVSLDPAGRYLWGPNMVSPMSLGSARMMETWAHSLDIHGGLGIDYADTDRVKHVAFLGWRAVPYAFSLKKEDAPGAVRIELEAPSGVTWTFGPEDAPNRITGSGSDWARVVARRDRDGAADRLQRSGPDADRIIEYGRAFL